MNKALPSIYFYVPSHLWPSDISLDTGYFWSENRSGKYNWTIQTYHHLKAEGFPCNLVQRMPDDGIVLAHREVLPDHLIPGPRQLFVCIQADHGRHPYAQIHLLQNKQGTLQSDRSLRDRVDRLFMPFGRQSFFIRYWPQPELIPRKPSYGDRFQNIVYMGRAKNLASELKDPQFSRHLKSLGFRWRIDEKRVRWKDYSDVDAVVAVRSFDAKRYLHKPATKLYNAWHAGVPAILGPDSAFHAERKSDLDYIEVTSPEGIIDALRRLRDDEKLRQAMVENGRMRARETLTETLVGVWRAFLIDRAVPAYHLWCRKSRVAQASFLAARRLALQVKKPNHHGTL